VDGCPTLWKTDSFFHHNTDDPHWRLGWSGRLQIAQLVPSGATHVQVSIIAVDACPFFCSIYGPGTCHSHGPLIDNVRVGRIDTPGPIWAPHDWTLKVYEPELFQDNFPEIAEYTRPGTGEVTSAGKVRIDIGQDILSSTYSNILPGDSLRIIVLEPTYGLGPDPSGGRWDSLISNEPGTVLAVTVADCVPVFFVDVEELAFGVAHAGWRGLWRGIVKRTVTALMEEFDTKPANLLVGTGPAIRGPSYEVGPDVAGLFPEPFTVPVGDAGEGRAQIDLPSCALADAAGAGVPKDNLVDFSACTFQHAEDLFSHRRGDRERHWAFIGRSC